MMAHFVSLESVVSAQCLTGIWNLNQELSSEGTCSPLQQGLKYCQEQMLFRLENDTKTQHNLYCSHLLLNIVRDDTRHLSVPHL